MMKSIAAALVCAIEPAPGEETAMEKHWTRAGGATGEKFICVVTFLPVRRWRDIVAFIRMSVRIEAQLKRSPSLVGYGLKTNLPGKQFWTLSVWNERRAVNGFVGSEPHATAVKRFERWAGPGAAFAEWESAHSQPSWDEALKKLETPTFYYQPTASR
ncbi:MAG: hypothetical protein ACRD3D_13755 [Terriglobia bacterium]